MGLQLKRGEWALFLFTLAYVAGFAAYYLFIRDFEFLWYIAVLAAFFVLVVGTLHKTKFDYSILGGLSLWGLLHLAGGGVPAGETVLYGATLIPLAGDGELSVLKYDQAVHFFGFFVATLVVFHVLRPHLAARPNWGVVYATVALAGAGLGVLNEIVEFAAVLAVPETGVGGYANTALDLVFNTLGAAAAAAFIHFRKMHRE